MHLVDTDLGGHCVRRGLRVACKHHGAAHACAVQGVHGLLRAGLHLIRDQDMPRVGAVHRQMHHRADAVAVLAVDALGAHVPAVARGDLPPVHARDHAVAADLLHVGHAIQRQLPAIGLAQALTDGV